MPITSLRYQRNENLAPQREIMRGYFREIIHSHGEEALYLKRDIRFFDEALRDKANLVYGEDPTSKYSLAKPMLVYIEQSQDNMFLSHFGFETDGSSTGYIMIDDFYDNFKNDVGVPSQFTFDTGVDVLLDTNIDRRDGTVIVNGISSTILSGLVVEGEYLAGFNLKGDRDLEGTITFSGNSMTDLVNERILSKLIRVHNPYIKSPLFRNDDATFNDEFADFGALVGVINSTVDIDGNGTFTVEIDYIESFTYWKNVMEGTANRWEVAPVIGDIIRLAYYEGHDNEATFEGKNNEEYEITKVTDNDKTTGGLNPLLDTYVWKCSLVRRDPSHEEVTATGQQLEPYTPLNEVQNIFAEAAADNELDYETEVIDEHDGVNSDDIYGGYEMDEDTVTAINTITNDDPDDDENNIYGGF